MKRRNTIDSLHVNWPIVQYYYTHNNGSCDDILMQHKSFDTPRKFHHNPPNYNNRRRTFPMERSGGLHPQQQDRRQSYKIGIVTPSPIIRRVSSCQRQQQYQRHKKKRETLANIISNLSRSNSSILTSGNISSIINDDNTRVDSDLDIKWEAIRQYNPQLDNEKILEQNSEDEDEGYSHDLPSQEQRNEAAAVVVDINDDSNNSSSNDSNGLFLPAGQEADENGTGPSDAMSIQIDTAANSHQIAATTVIAPKTELLAATMLVPLSSTVDHTDMLLFLFGFIFFPLWWIGTWRFFMQSDKAILHKQQRGFQIVNCCMSLASLLLTGLIIGLVTVWA
ncbi:hypothetical protein MAM1_0326c09707 [Mucor ambiguus]|uniref:Uncharacterized protein n=1 Tax=Mucor ambiguus TaxID=91626 RepID=A0A0C9LXK7_9FUNG|nr:hypothetical protein MAM1_0326c09707 [Mucor ambiguus]